MPIPDRLLEGTPRDFRVGHLFESSPIELTQPGERQLLCFVLPPWQRPDVWTTQQKSRFIESLFLGLGPGYYVVNGVEFDQKGEPLPGSGWLLDGQQRITAIQDFVDNKFRIFGDTYCQDMGTITLRRRFFNLAFPCVELAYSADENLLKTLYNRLNFGGTPHSPEQRALIDESSDVLTPALKKTGDPGATHDTESARRPGAE